MVHSRIDAAHRRRGEIQRINLTADGAYNTGITVAAVYTDLAGNRPTATGVVLLQYLFGRGTCIAAVGVLLCSGYSTA